MNATLMRLLWVFSMLSVLGFGGGKGIIPEMRTYSVSTYHWATASQFAEFYTIGKMVPGPTTIFSALVGYGAAGVLGAIAATSALFLPSSVLMIGAGSLFARFARSPLRSLITHGLAPAIVGLVWSSVLSIGKGVPITIATVAIGLGVAVLSIRSKLSAPALIAVSGIAGLLWLR